MTTAPPRRQQRPTKPRQPATTAEVLRRAHTLVLAGHPLGSALQEAFPTPRRVEWPWLDAINLIGDLMRADGTPAVWDDYDQAATSDLLVDAIAIAEAEDRSDLADAIRRAAG